MDTATSTASPGYEKTLGDYISLAKRRKFLFLGAALLVFLVGIAVAFLLPPSYRSAAMILIEEPEVPPELVESTVTSYADQRIQLIKYRVITTETLGRIINQFGLYRDLRNNTSLPEIIQKFRESIDVETIEARVLDPRNGRPTRATIAFTVGYTNAQPAKAQQVANELVTLFLSENTRERQSQASATTNFLAQEADRLGRRVKDLERQIAVFKQKYAGKLPHQLNANLQMVEQARRDLGQIDRRILSLRERRNFLSAELEMASAQLAAGSDNGKVSPWMRLVELRGELASLRQTLGPNHPQLIQVKNKVGALENILNGTSSNGGAGGSRLALAALRGETADTAPADPATNPLYVQLRSQLKAAEVELAELRSERTSLEKSIESYNTRIAATPEVEREYQSLVRDYDNARRKYNETKGKQLEAELSQSLETERKSERFVLIEPPQRPIQPVGLGKGLIVAIGFLGAVVAGAGIVMLADMFDNRIYGPRQLAAASGAVPLQVVPYIYTPAERRKGAAVRILVTAFVVVAGAGILAAVHYWVMPLDALWFRTVSDVRALVTLPTF